ncbi:T9SS type A sorting domain-containing protein [Geofilum sp. OHC36d9]|uniref:T9SS type A sorting domain-containing protein n=1 Tax=Geofilum sp. OHC36d9 TaxID=3458413 RepID=UPI004034B6A3
MFNQNCRWCEFTILTGTQKVVSVEVYNPIGQLVFSQPVYNNNIPVSLNNRESGLYLIKISTGEEVIVKKIIVE